MYFAQQLQQRSLKGKKASETDVRKKTHPIKYVAGILGNTEHNAIDFENKVNWFLDY